MKVAAEASALRHRFDDVDVTDSVRVASARQLLPLDPQFLAQRYATHAHLLRPIIDDAVAAHDTTVLPLVAQLFERSSGEARIDFSVDLIAFGTQAGPHLRPLLSRSDPGLVVRAADALSQAAGQAAIDDLIPLLSRQQEWIRMGGAHALGRLEGPQATEALVTALQDTAYAVVNAALVGLARQQATGAFDAVRPLLDDARPEVRKHAAHALGEFGDQRATDALRRVSQQDDDSGVRFMAQRALQSLADVP